MIGFDKQTLDRGQRVRVTRQDYAAEADGFAPLKETLNEAEALTQELARREGEQNTDTTPETHGKDAWREVMARQADTLSKQAVAWAVIKSTVTMKLKLTISYTDLRYGEADADVDAARALVALVRAIPAAERTTFRISDALATEVEQAADEFEQAEDAQIDAKQQAQLATLSIPELGRRLRAKLELAKQLINGQKEASDRWAEFAKRFNAANKNQKQPGEARRAKKARVVKQLPARGVADETFQMDDQNYEPLYELRVENTGPTDLRLWMGLEPDGAAHGTVLVCPAGMKRTFRRSELGPETARRLMGQFVGAAGEAKVTVRRVVASTPEPPTGAQS